jgi:hypothetical protein
VAFAGFLLLGFRKRRSRLWVGLIGSSILAGALGLSVGCGGGGSNPTSTAEDVVKGAYTLTLDGTDTSNSSIAASTTLTLTVN